MNKQEFYAIPENERIRYLDGTLFYTSAGQPNRSAERKFGALPKYVTTIVLDAENQAKAISYGLNVKQPKEGEEVITGPYIEIKRNIKTEADLEKARPALVDSEQNPIPYEVLIGNGSQGRVKFGTYWYENFGGGVGSTLFTIQVKELVPYIGGNGDPNLVNSGGGFKVSDVNAGTPAFDDDAEAQPAAPAAAADDGGLFD